jgi:Holliday junction DNA helicase RuvA
VSLYGFTSAEDLRLFKVLIGVSGVGPRGALSLLSALGADGLSMRRRRRRTALPGPGVGQKTAARLALGSRASWWVSRPHRDSGRT